MRNVIAATALLLGLVSVQQVSKEELRRKLKDEVHPAWIYDDMPAALAAAKKSGKPVLAVFR